MKTFKHNTFEIGSRNIIVFDDKPTVSKNSGRKLRFAPFPTSWTDHFFKILGDTLNIDWFRNSYLTDSQRRLLTLENQDEKDFPI